MVKLRHPNPTNKLNELNRLVWFGLLLLVSGSAAILVATNFFSQPLLTAKNYMLLAIIAILLILFVYRLVGITRKPLKTPETHGKQK